MKILSIAWLGGGCSTAALMVDGEILASIRYDPQIGLDLNISISYDNNIFYTFSISLFFLNVFFFSNIPQYCITS